VLATNLGITEQSSAIGAPAIAGMWAEYAADWESAGDEIAIPPVAGLPKNAPVLAHTEVCVALALGIPEAVAFWQSPPVEIRLATASYLSLLDAAESDEQLAALRRFVQPFAVLSLGPMASSKSVELMLSHTLTNELTPLDSLIAATALAHDIPILTTNPAPFQNIRGLQVVRPF
jgi:predicted nucleic acid-binding protein